MSALESFMAADPDRGVALDICKVPAGLRFTAHGSSVVSVWLDPNDALDIAASVLHAAGREDVAALIEAESAEEVLRERREVVIRGLGSDRPYESFIQNAPFRNAVDRIIELEDGQANR